MSISLNIVPVREETLGQFTASNPWSGNPAEKWTLNLYRLVSETLAPSIERKFLKQEQANQADMGSHRSAVQSRKLNNYQTMGFESADGRQHMLPRALVELWRNGDVSDQDLPRLINQFEPRLKRSDFPSCRGRILFKWEAILFLVVAFLCLVFVMLDRWLASSQNRILERGEPAIVGWVSFALALPFVAYLLFARAWRRHDDRLKEEFRMAAIRMQGASAT